MFWRNKKKPNKISLQYFNEEILNVVTHLTALFAFSFMSGIMLVKTQSFWTDLIYCFFTINVYMSSMLYHYFEKIKLKRILRTIDHSSINLLIAATYTPFMIYIDNIVLLSIIWTIAISNVVEMFYYKTISRLSLMKYLLMGWGAVVAFPQLYQNLPTSSLCYLIGGGLAYTAGVYFFINDQKHKYYHSIWHVFTAAGTFLHYFAVFYQYN